MTTAIQIKTFPRTLRCLASNKKISLTCPTLTVRLDFVEGEVVYTQHLR